MIIKFDGIDGCGKTTLAESVAQHLSKRGHLVASVAEFSSPSEYRPGSLKPVPVAAMKVREAALDPEFGCDDIERQLLLHFLSRRKNRVEIPYLDQYLDFRGYAAARAQACWTSRISSVVAGRGDVGRNRAAMIWRRRLVSMSRVEGSVFDPYHGADARRCATSAVGWPWRVYQMMSRL